MDAIDQRIGRESAEYNRVWGADARARQHGDRQLRRHSHINGDAVTFFHAQRLQNIGELLHLAVQLLVGKRHNFPGFALPNNRGFVLAPGLYVTIQAVVREIDPAADKPFCPRAIPLENLVPGLEPVQFAGDTRPKLLGLVNRLFIKMLVFLKCLNVSLLAEFRRTFELALLIQNGIDVRALSVDHSFIGHEKNLDAEEWFSRTEDQAQGRKGVFYTAPNEM